MSKPTRGTRTDRLHWLMVGVAILGCSRGAPGSSGVSKPVGSEAGQLRGSASSQSSATPRADRDSSGLELSQAARKLAAVETFALGGVGIAGEQSQGERLTLALAREPNAVPIFETLLEHPNRVARLYAYWALQSLDPERAKRHQAVLASDPEIVQTMSGCILFSKPTRELAAELDHFPRPIPQP